MRSNLESALSAATGLPIEKGIYRVEALSRYPELLHGITTRTAPDGEDWNLSGRRGTPAYPPDPQRALANRQKVAERLGVPLHRMVGCQQVHSAKVAVVGHEDAGRGMYAERPSIQGADALVTGDPGLYLMVLSADCPPVFVYDPVRQVVGLAHSGWKGTAARIAGNVVEAMVDNFGSEARDIVAVVGPGIGPCCYAVGQNVVNEVEAGFFEPWGDPEPLLERRGEQVYFNIPATIRRALLDAGVPARNATVEGVCTADNLGAFYSHRGEAGQCGLFSAVLGLRDG